MSSLAALRRLGLLQTVGTYSFFLFRTMSRDATEHTLLRDPQAPRVGWRSRAASRSCAGETPPPATPSCVPHPRPSCRPPPPRNAASAVRVVCCAPTRGRRPPCDPRPAAKPLTCDNARVRSFVYLIPTLLCLPVNPLSWNLSGCTKGVG